MSAPNILLLFSTAFLGGMAVFFFRTDVSRRLKLILSFSGAYLFAITVLHLIPEVYASGSRYTGVFILIGFAFQIILEQFSEGIEHGHIHKHDRPAAFPVGIMLSLCIHAFLEGMPLGERSNSPLLFGIALHHIPASFALGSILVQNGMSRKQIILLLCLFGLMTPSGMLLGSGLGSSDSSGLSSYFDPMMGIVIGIFLHISTTILFESSVDHRFNFYKMLAILAGAGIALLNYFL